MNERIKELAEQASKDKDYGYPVTLEYTNRFAEKFAQLIVRETLHTALYGDEFESARSNVKTFFGVEE